MKNKTFTLPCGCVIQSHDYHREKKCRLNKTCDYDGKEHFKGAKDE